MEHLDQHLAHLRLRAVVQRERAALQQLQQQHGRMMFNNRRLGQDGVVGVVDPARLGMGIVDRVQLQGLQNPPRGRKSPHVSNIHIEEDILSYSGEAGDQTGIYIAAQTIEQYNNYFEIQILDVGDMGQIGIGLVPVVYAANVQPGIEAFSVGYMAENGKIYINHGRGARPMTYQGPACGLGDKIGVGVRFVDENVRPEKRGRRVFFTRNGQEVKYIDLGPRFALPLYPAVGMQSEGEEVALRLDAVWKPEDVTQMLVDCAEDDWIRLDDIHLNGNILEYTGRGRMIHDVGLAQAKYPLDTTNHYFEFEIVDPGEKSYLAIGLARRNYPARRHPGWNHGSIAYHADDGKLFHGSGMGRHFGPRCSLGDVMGCGIFFPLDYDVEVENIDEDDLDPDIGRGHGGGEDGEGEEFPVNNFLWASDEEEEEEGGDPLMGHHGGVRRRERGRKVKVFFKRNGKLIGLREVTMPRGGFYPTIGMASANERVRVDLRPMTG